MPDLEICEINLLRGPNVWANYPVLEAWVDLGGLKDASSDELPGFNERLKSWLPGLIEHRCSVGERSGFFQRLDRGTYPAHVLEHVTLELQTLAGHHLGFGKARATPVEGIYKVVVRYLDEVLVVACLRGARELLLAAYHDEAFDVAAEVARLRAVALRSALGPSTMAIVDAARDRGIPWRRIREDISLVQLGHGARQRRVWTAETDRSGAISEYIAQDKDLTRMLLRQAGVPVPHGRKVDDPDDAWDAAESMAVPVVVKPLDANHGRGVFIDLVSETQVRNSFGYALEEGGGVVVEKFVPGTDHRLLVVGSRMIAASKGYPAVVVGDGSHSIRKLVISQLRTSVQTGRPDECPWSKIDDAGWETSVLLDLEDQGFSLDSVPRDGERVMVARFSGDGDRLAGSHGILLHPWTQVAICEAGAEHILSDGLGFDRCTVGVVLNVGVTHLGQAHVETLEEMSVAKRCIVDVVLPTGTAVLNADDPLVAAMAGKCKGAVMFFTCDPNNPIAAAHRAAGGRVVLLQDGVIYLTEEAGEKALCTLAEVVMPEGGDCHAENVLAAVAAAWAHGLSAARIAEGLAS